METKGSYEYIINPAEQRFCVGARVSGLFYGVEYSGVVIEAHSHSRNLSYIHKIRLHQPVDVFGLTRQQITISVWEPIPSGNTITFSL